MPIRRSSWVLGALAALAGTFALWVWRTTAERSSAGRAPLEGLAQAASGSVPTRAEAGLEPRAAGLAPPGPGAVLDGTAPEREALPTAKSAVLAGDAAPGPYADLPEASFAGRVLDATSGAGLSGVRVLLSHEGFEREAESDAQGAFALAWPSGVAAELALLHPRYVDLRVAQATIDAELVFRLTPSARLQGKLAPWPPAGASGAAESEASGDAARVILWPHSLAGGEREPLTEAIVDGRFAFLDVEPGAYKIACVLPGAVAEEPGTLELAAGETRQIELALRAGGVLFGRVRHGTGGGPAAGASVRVESLRTRLPKGLEAPRLEALSDAGGRFEVRGLEAGPQRVEVRLGPLVTRAGAVVPESLQPAELVVALPEAASLGGLVLDAAGRPVEGARVVLLARSHDDDLEELLASRGAGALLQAETDAGGAFALEGAPAGEPLFLLAFSEASPAPGVTSIPALLPGVGGQSALVRLPGGAPLAGRVLGEDGLPPPAARVTLSLSQGKTSAEFASVDADAEGFFRFDDAPIGDVSLRAEADGYRAGRLRLSVGAAGVSDALIELATGYRIAGRVLDDAGAGRSGLRVRLSLDPDSIEGRLAAEQGGKGMRQQATTDAYGRFLFDRLARGRWLPSVESDDWELARSTPFAVLVPGAEEEQLVLELRARPRPEFAAIEGEVWARDGQELFDLRVQGLGRGATLAIAGAGFRASGVAPGEKKLVISAQGLVPERRTLVLDAGVELDLGRIELEPGTRVDIEVQDAEGKPIRNARVMLRPTGAKVAGEPGRSFKLEHRGDGLYRLAAAPRGRWRLEVSAPGKKSRVQELELRENPSLSRVQLSAGEGQKPR